MEGYYIFGVAHSYLANNIWFIVRELNSFKDDYSNNNYFIKRYKKFLLAREQVWRKWKNTRKIVSQGGSKNFFLVYKMGHQLTYVYLEPPRELVWYVSHALVSCYCVAFSIPPKALSRFCARWHPSRVRLRWNSVLRDRIQGLRLTVPLFVCDTRLFPKSIWRVHVCIVIYYCLIRDSTLSVEKAIVLTSRLKYVKKNSQQ